MLWALKRRCIKYLLAMSVIYMVTTFLYFFSYQHSVIFQDDHQFILDQTSSRHLLTKIPPGKETDSGNVNALYRWFKQLFEKPANVIAVNTSSINHLPSFIVNAFKRYGQAVLVYDKFRFTEPLMVSERDRDTFYENVQNVKELGTVPQEKLRGEISLLENVLIHEGLDCGWKSASDIFTSSHDMRLQVNRIINDNIVCPLLVPDGASFQHFTDGVLPKIIQVYPLLQEYNASLLLYQPLSDIIVDMLETMGLPRSRLIFHSHKDVFLIKGMINTCVTPPLHPVLFQEARKKLGVRTEIAVHKDKSLIILLTRGNHRNPGREMKNQQEVYKYLLTKFGKDRILLFKETKDLKESKTLFSKAKIIIGVHGGAFYNMLFAPKGTHIIEASPITTPRDMRRIAHTIFWQLSQVLGHNYWRMSEYPTNTLLDLPINMYKLDTIITKIKEEYD